MIDFLYMKGFAMYRTFLNIKGFAICTGKIEHNSNITFIQTMYKNNVA